MQLLVLQLPGGVLDIDGVVSDALEVTDGMEQAGNGADVRHGHAVLGDLYQIAAQPVLVGVQLVLIFKDLGLPLLTEAGELFHCQQHIVPGGFPHPAGHGHALADGHAGGADQEGVQEGKLLGGVFRTDQSPRQLFQLAGERQEQQRGEDIEYGVAEGDAHGAHRPVHEGETEDHVAAVEEDQAHHSADDVEGDVDHRHPLCVAVDTDGAEQRGDAGTDILAHDDGNGHAVRDGTGQRQSL